MNRLARVEAVAREAIQLAYGADACCDGEFRLPTDGPCETEARLAVLTAILDRRSEPVIRVETVIDRWLRRYDDLPVSAWDGSLRRGSLVVTLAVRRISRAIVATADGFFRWLPR